MAGKTVIEEFIATLGWEVETEELEDFQEQVSDAGEALKWIAGAIVGASAAMAAFVTTTNAQTSVQTNLARSFGISAEAVENWGYLLGTVGFDGGQVVMMMRDLNLNIGRIQSRARGFQVVEDAVKRLGLSVTELTALKPEQQFIEVLKAAQKMDDGQAAIALSYRILGTEAAKVVGWLRTQNEEVDVLIEQQAKVNILNEEARQMAVQYTALWDNFSAVIDSAKKTLAGYLGEAISPVFRATIDWVSANKDLIRIEIKKWADSLVRSFKWFWSSVRDIIYVVWKAADSLGGLKNVLKTIFLLLVSFKIAAFVSALTSLALVIKAITASKFVATLRLFASPIGVLTVLLTALVFVIEDLIVYFKGGNSLLGKWGDTIAEFVDTHITGLIASLFGLSREEFNLAFVDAVESFVTFIYEDIPQAINSLINWLKNLFNIVNNDSLTITQKILSIFSVFIEGAESWLVAALDFWKGFFNAVVNIAGNAIMLMGNFFLDLVDNVFPGFKDSVLSFVQSIYSFFSNLGKSIVNVFKTALNSVMSMFGMGVSKIKGLISKVPGIGSSFNVKGFDLGASLIGSVNALSPSQNILTQTSNRAIDQSKIDVSVNQTIQQLPGENSQDFARRSNELLRQEIATAVRNNESGIVY